MLKAYLKYEDWLKYNCLPVKIGHKTHIYNSVTNDFVSFDISEADIEEYKIKGMSYFSTTFIAINIDASNKKIVKEQCIKFAEWLASNMIFYINKKINFKTLYNDFRKHKES